VNNQRTFIFLGILVGLSICIGLFREPQYQGRSLTNWLQQYADSAGNETQRLEQASTAVRAIGAKKALPIILDLVETKDDRVSLWLIDKWDKYKYRLLATFRQDPYQDDLIRLHDAREFQLYGLAGLEILGTNAAPIAPELGKILSDKEYDFVIKRGLLLIGKPAEPVLCCALTNQDADIRAWSVDAVLDVTSDVGAYITRIKPLLHDPVAEVRGAAVEAIGWQTEAPDLALPLLVASLKDPADSVSARAADALSGFGANSLPFFLTLSNLAESGDPGTAKASLKTLVTIDPKDAFPVLTNFIARGKPGADDVLRAFAKAAPDRALPVILNRLQSPDPKTRGNALGMLLHYPATPAIESVLEKIIATGSDPNFIPNAKRYLTDEYVASHPEESLFTNEPMADGKHLGEWLETRNHNNNSGDFSPAAKKALHELGTNAIPALLKRLAYARPPYCFGPLQINVNAACAMIVLGDQAKSALPDLLMLMDSTNEEIALTSMMASLGTGSNGMPFLIKGLTNPFPDVRNQAADIFSGDFGNKFPGLRKPALPLFVKLLDDPDDDIRINATNQLKAMDPTTAIWAGIK
jgi:HEAT repeat protein